MGTPDPVTELVARLLRMPSEEVSPAVSLRELSTSIGLTRLRLGLGKLGYDLRVRRTPETFGALTMLLLDAANEAEPPMPLASQVRASRADDSAKLPGLSSGAIRVGVDIQGVRCLPETDDYWRHEFYSSTFDDHEIGYAVVQPEPKVHFAGFWCAKEALRKCNGALGEVPLKWIVVSHRKDGRPYLRFRDGSDLVEMPHELSISHTRDYAVAVVIDARSAER